MLNAHSQIGWQSELFHEFHERVTANKTREEPVHLLQASIAEDKNSVFGFECKFQHLDSNGLDLSFDTFIDQLLELGFTRFIILNRNNYLRQAISVARGQASRNWHIQAEQTHPPANKVRLNLQEIGLGGRNREMVDCFRYLESQYALALETLSSKNCPLLQLCYEDDLERDPRVGYQKTVDFLSVDEERPEISLQKIGGSAIRTMVENFEEVQMTLRGTDFEWMLSG
jgi:LPS sulfotransferase NodH